MDEYGWGLTSAGFRRPTYNELLDALEHKARELFGATANLTVRSPLGLFLRIFAWILNILFSVLEDVYNSRFVDTAVGTSLLNLGRAIGLRVLSAQKASGYIMVTGPPGVIVPAGWLVETAAGIQFFAVSDTEIGADGTVMVPFRCTSTGPDGNVAAGTITTITNPGSVAGITAVTNPAAFTGGRERETDEEFRDRYYASVDYAGGVNADSIRAALLQNVDGIMESSVELMADIEKGKRFDIMLLDILMPGENGMTAAREVREHDTNVKIIFLTASPEFAVESYAVDAWYYQLKPIRQEDFFRLMDSACAACSKEQTHSLILRSKSGIVRVELEKLVYCEVMGRTLTFHLNSGVVLESMGRLDDLCDQLMPYPNFLRPHRSFLINMEYIANIAARSITMQNGAEVPVPHGKYSELKNRYLSYIFDRKKAVL